MPPRKRSNWRQPTVFDHSDGGGRRTTRAARQSAGQSHKSSSSQYATRDGVTVNVSRSKEPVQGWIEVWRAPAPNVGFAVPIWVQIDKLTPEEREEYLPSTENTKPEDEMETKDQVKTTTRESYNDVNLVKNGAELMQMDTLGKTNVYAETTQQPSTSTTTHVASADTTWVHRSKSETNLTQTEDEIQETTETSGTLKEVPKETAVEISTENADFNPNNGAATESVYTAIDNTPVEPMIEAESSQVSVGNTSQPSEVDDPKADAEILNFDMGETKVEEDVSKSSTPAESVVEEDAMKVVARGRDEPNDSVATIEITGTTKDKTEEQTHAIQESSTDQAQTGDDTRTDSAEEPEAKRQRLEGPGTTSTYS